MFETLSDLISIAITWSETFEKEVLISDLNIYQYSTNINSSKLGNVFSNSFFANFISLNSEIIYLQTKKFIRFEIYIFYE